MTLQAKEQVKGGDIMNESSTILVLSELDVEEMNSASQCQCEDCDCPDGDCCTDY